MYGGKKVLTEKGVVLVRVPLLHTHTYIPILLVQAGFSVDSIIVSKMPESRIIWNTLAIKASELTV